MTREQFIEQVRLSQESLRRFLCVLCGGDCSRADDIAQEALLKAYLSFGRFEGKARFSTWLFRIAYNCFYDHKYKSGKCVMEPLADEASSGLRGDGSAELSGRGYADESECADKRFEHQQLYIAIEALSEHERTIVLLFYMEDKSINDIVVITGMPSGTVRSYLSRARGHLRESLSRLR